MHIYQKRQDLGGGIIRRRFKRRNLWLILFVIGLSGGTFFANYMTDGGAWFMEIMENIPRRHFHEDIQAGVLIHIFVKRFLIFIFLLAGTLLIRRSLILYLSTVYLGFCFGTIIAAATAAAGVGGLKFLAGLLLPQYLLYIPAYLFVLEFTDRIFHTGGQGFYGGRIHYGGAFLLLFVMVSVGCVLEGVINPVWLAFFAG